MCFEIFWINTADYNTQVHNNRYIEATYVYIHTMPKPKPLSRWKSTPFYRPLNNTHTLSMVPSIISSHPHIVLFSIVYICHCRRRRRTQRYVIQSNIISVEWTISKGWRAEIHKNWRGRDGNEVNLFGSLMCCKLNRSADIYFYTTLHTYQRHIAFVFSTISRNVVSNNNRGWKTLH